MFIVTANGTDSQSSDWVFLVLRGFSVSFGLCLNIHIADSYVRTRSRKRGSESIE